MSFAYDKTQNLELIDTPCMKPSKFGHMISNGKDAYPVSLKQSRLVKVIVYQQDAQSVM